MVEVNWESEEFYTHLLQLWKTDKFTLPELRSYFGLTISNSTLHRRLQQFEITGRISRICKSRAPKPVTDEIIREAVRNKKSMTELFVEGYTYRNIYRALKRTGLQLTRKKITSRAVAREKVDARTLYLEHERPRYSLLPNEYKILLVHKPWVTTIQPHRIGR